MNDFLKQIADFSPKRLLLLATELEERVRLLEGRTHAPIAIIGMGCRFPGGIRDTRTYWNLLSEGRDAITEVPQWRWDVNELYNPDPHATGHIATRWGGFIDSPELFDPSFFGIAPVEAESMDPQQRLLLEVSWEALEDAAIDPTTLAGSRTGVYVGMCNADYAQRTLLHTGRGVDAYFAQGASHAIASGRISYFLGLRGPSIAIDTACSSSLVTVHQACQSLRLNETDLALAGGVNLLFSAEITMALSRAQMMAPDGRCKPFSAEANGFVRSEGCGMVVLKRLDDALRDGDRVVAVIRGTAVNQDGRSSGITAPNGPAQEDVIRAALADAGIAPQAVGYIEAHGTGTHLGDPIELRALNEAFGKGRTEETRLVVGSVKSNFGHAESAAGVAGLIKLVLALEHGEIPANLHFTNPNPEVDWENNRLRIPEKSEPWLPMAGESLRIGALSSMGFSGTNAHAILSEPPGVPAEDAAYPQSRNTHVIPLSARSEEALRVVATQLADRLREDATLRLEDVAYTLSAGRAAFAHRTAIRTESKTHLIENLSHLAQRENVEESGFFRGFVEVRKPRVAFLLSGQGGEYAGMGLSLLAHSPVFRAAIAEVDAALTRVIPTPIEAILCNQHGELTQSALVQPAHFAYQYGLARMWQSWGIEPHVVVGHSLGEFLACTLAGVMTVEDASLLVAARGRLTGELGDPGGMVAITASEEQALAGLAGYEADVSLAVINGPQSVVISGRRAPLEQATQGFERTGFRVKRLKSTDGFHSPAMDRVLPAFYQAASRVGYHAPHLPIISALTGEMVHDTATFNAQYFTGHMSRPVQFQRCLERLEKEGCSVCIEMGPRAVLTAFGRERGEPNTRWIASANGREDDLEALQSALAEAFVGGASLDWKAVFRGRSARKAALPTYPFERERYWIAAEELEEPGANAQRKSVRHAASAAPVQASVSAEPSPVPTGEGWLYEQMWQPAPLAAGSLEREGNWRWIIVGANAGPAQAVADHLTALGQDAQLASSIDVIDFSHTADTQLQVVDLRAIESEADILPQLSAEAVNERAVALTTASVDLWQRLLQAEGSLWIFTQGAQDTGPAPQLAGALQSTLWGLARCASLEHPQRLRRIIDLEQSMSVQEIVSIVAQELLSGDDEEQVAYEGKVRRAFRFRPSEQRTAGPFDSSKAFCKDGSYLVTGGVGGLGFRVAEWLGKQGAGRLVLTTRSLASVAARQQEIDALKASGVEVTIVQADVADSSAMQQLFLRFENGELPPLRGIFHIAADISGASLEGIKAAQVQSMFRAKVAGTWTLHQITRTLPLDFFVAFSSTAAVLGARDLGHYAAANSFLDGMAALRAAEKLPFTSISWGTWQTMRVASMEAQQQIFAGGMLAMQDDAGLEWLGYLSQRSDLRQPSVANVNWELLAPLYESKRLRRWLEYVRPQLRVPEPGAKPLWSAEPGESRLQSLERAVQKEAARVLGFRRGEVPDADSRLADLGLDSLMAVNLRNRLQRLIGYGLSPTFAFEYPTPAQMAMALDMLLWGSGVIDEANSNTERDEIQI
jgi:acyl transferase domain-containing protein